MAARDRLGLQRMLLQSEWYGGSSDDGAREYRYDLKALVARVVSAPGGRVADIFAF